jgi:formylmethanofuran dehydrogenase subunit E
MSMQYPAFFDKVKTIVLYDPLAEFLGAAKDGRVEYNYLDAVKLAGHSCPTVAGAYLMTMKALEALYPGTTPERGAVRVRLRDAMEFGVTGVIANVVGLITGATQQNGFKGIDSRFDRRNLLFFDTGIDADIHFERADSGAAVTVAYRAELVPGSARLKALAGKLGAPGLSAAEQHDFGVEWQARVERILIEQADNPALVVVTAASPGHPGV